MKYQLDIPTLSVACYKVTPEAKLHITMHSGEGSTKSTAAEGKEIKTKPSKILSNNNYKKKTLHTYNIHYIYTVFSNGHSVAT